MEEALAVGELGRAAGAARQSVRGFTQVLSLLVDAEAAARPISFRCASSVEYILHETNE